jgi:hypothetical protein
MKQEFFVTFQSKKTGKYRDKHYTQSFLPFPTELSRLWDIEKGQTVRLLINGNDEIILNKVQSKPTAERPKYEEWLEKIKPHIPTEPPGKTYHQICVEADLEMKSAPAEWVHKAENDIGLNNDNKDPKNHQTLWYRKNIKPDGKDQKPKETEFRESTLVEFQVRTGRANNPAETR